MCYCVGSTILLLIICLHFRLRNLRRISENTGQLLRDNERIKWDYYDFDDYDHYYDDDYDFCVIS